MGSSNWELQEGYTRARVRRTVQNSASFSFSVPRNRTSTVTATGWNWGSISHTHTSSGPGRSSRAWHKVSHVLWW